MKKNIFIIASVALLTILVVMFFAQKGKIQDETLINSSNKTLEEESTTNISGNSRYIEYSKTNLENSLPNRRVLFFYASWCPTCRPTDANFKANSSKLPEDLVVIRVNYNDPDTDQEEENLAKKYEITYQHTFVQIDESGNEITKWNGGQLEELLTRIK